MINAKKTFTFAAFSIFALVLITGLASAVLLTEWDFEGETLTPSTDLTSGAVLTVSDARTPTFPAGNAPSAVDSFSVSGWNVADRYVELDLSTAGYEDLTLKLDEQASGTGPTEFKVQYSSDGSTFTDLPASTTSTVAAFVANPMHTFDFSAITAIDDNANTKFRIVVPTTGVGSGAGGTLRLDNVQIEGTVAASTPNPSLTIVKTQELTETQNGIIRVENNGNVDLTGISLTSSGDFSVTLNPSGSFNLNIGATKTITVSSTDLDNLDFGINTATITATTGSTTASTSFDIESSFCRYGEKGGNLRFKDIAIDNRGDGDDDAWLFLDVIEVEVEVENNGVDDIDNVMIELGFFDSDGSNQADELEFENSEEEEFDIGKLKDGKDEIVTFRFRVPADMEDGDYKLTIKVYSDGDEDIECADSSNDLSDDIYESIAIERESDSGKFIAFEDIVMNPTEATCGERVSLTTDVYNIGDEDQDQVKIILRNPELKVEEFFEIRNDLDQGDKETLSFDFVIPSDAKDKLYDLELRSEYDYNRGNYRESSDNAKLVSLRVLGCAPTSPVAGTRIAAVNAVLKSEAVAGEQLIVSATITNLQSSTSSFIIGAEGYQSWATLTDISDRLINLGTGEGREVTFTFDVGEDVEGQESFDIKIISGEATETKEVAVNIAAKAGVESPFNFGGDNAYLWIIGIVNVVLIVLIIVVAVRISRR